VPAIALRRRTQPDVSNKAGRNVRTAATRQPRKLTQLPDLTTPRAPCLLNLLADLPLVVSGFLPVRQPEVGYGRLRKVTEGYGSNFDEGPLHELST